MRRTTWIFATLLACTSARPQAAVDRADAEPPRDPAAAANEAGTEPDAGAVRGALADAGMRSDAGSAPPPRVANPPVNPRCAGRFGPAVDGPLPAFEKRVLQELPGAGYLLPADLDADGYPELLVTTLTERVDLAAPGGGPPLSAGGAYVLARAPGAAPGELPRFTRTTAFDASAGILWPNASALFDVDGDARADWVIGTGFLTKPVGGLVWLRGAASGFGAPQSIPVPDPACFYHQALPLDFDGDGDNDFVTTCHVGSTKSLAGPSRLELFENRGAGAFAQRPLGPGGGALLALFDVDGDGDEDVIAPQFFEGPSLAWYERTSASELTPHVIDERAGRGFIALLGDVNGDGRTDLVFGDHDNEAAAAPEQRTMGIYWYEVPPREALAGLRDWSSYKHVVSEGFEVAGDGNGESAGAPGMLDVLDLDGDCDLDVTASGDGDLGLYAFVQGTSGFTRVVLDQGPGNVNAGEQHAFDIDGDGDLDVVWAVFGPNDPLGVLTSGLSSAVYAFVQR